jgi:hypothetical protein
MVGRWLVYVPDPEGGELQLSLPDHMKAEACALAAAPMLLAACKRWMAYMDGNSSLEDADFSHETTVIEAMREAIRAAEGMS